jgi:asparagine synthase (glutamine-hydrolysing)
MDRKLILGVNGEIYNHQEIRARYKDTYKFQTQSDCEVILALYRDKGKDFLEDLNGIFAFVLYDEINDCFLAARDHIGIIPLYMGWDAFGNYYFSSELKALEGICKKIEVFPPGHYYFSPEREVKSWYTRDWTDYQAVKDNRSDITELRTSLESAVHRQLMSDVLYGGLWS